MIDATHVPMFDDKNAVPENYPQKFVYPSKDTLPKMPNHKENK